MYYDLNVKLSTIPPGTYDVFVTAGFVTPGQTSILYGNSTPAVTVKVTE
jgi:hypothetical protein